MKRFKILSGTANPKLAEDIARFLDVELVPVEIRKFGDGEITCRIGESVRGHPVFVIQPTCPPTNESLMELLILIDALKRASAKEINAIIPYYGYARQDRKARPREPISAKLVANLLQIAGAHRVVSFDLHMGQIQGFFDIPTDNLEAMPLIANHFLRKKLDNLVVVSPDVGGTIRARKLAEALRTQLAIIDKRRPRPGEAEVVNVIGEVEGKDVLLLDDLIDSGGTIVKAAEYLRRIGVRDVYVAATHPVFSKGAIERLTGADLKEIVVTDTIPLAQPHENIVVLSVAEVLAHSIRSIREGESMGAVFDQMYANIRKV